MRKPGKSTAKRVRKRTRSAVLARTAVRRPDGRGAAANERLEAALARLEANAAELEERIDQIRAQLARRNGKNGRDLA